MISFRVALSAAVSLAAVACGSTTVIDAGVGGSASGGSSSGGNGVSSSSSGGSTGSLNLGGMGGGGTVMNPWDNSCSTGFVSIDTGMGPAMVLSSSCPDTWGAKFHDGPTANSVSAGALETLSWAACNAQGTPRLLLDSSSTATDTTSLSWAQYLDGSTVWSLSSGNLTFTQQGIVGEMIEGSYVATLSNANGNMQVTGTFSVCHTPTEALP